MSNSRDHDQSPLAFLARKLFARKTRGNKRRQPRFEPLEERALLISENGGVGGTSRSLPLTADLNLVKFRWENFSIPDEFQIVQAGKRIAGDVGLQSGGNSGKTIVSARSPGGQQTSNQLQIKVTAPRQGTAWNFDVTAEPLELIAEVKLGNVTGISIDNLFTKSSSGTTLSSLGFDMSTLEFVSMSNSKGKVAEVDNWKTTLQSKGVFYFAPTVTGTPLNYGTTNRTDAGLGESQLFVRGTVNPPFSSDGPRQIEFPIKLVVTDGFLTTFEDPGLSGTVPGVDGAGTTKLDIYRQEQRLAYLGYPRESGAALTVDGVISGGETGWAQRVFSIALDPAVSGRGQLPNPASGNKYFKDFINNAKAPYWRDLRSGIAGLTFPTALNGNERFFGSDNVGRMVTNANQSGLKSSGAAKKTGKGTPSVSHDGGRGFDLIPWYGSGQYYFDEVSTAGVRLVASVGGGFIFKNAAGQWQGGGALTNANQVASGLRVTSLVSDTSSTRTSEIAGLMKYRQEESTVRSLLDAFTGAGAPLVFYNDPRFFTATGVIRYNTSGSYNHFNHIHFVVPGGVPASAQANLFDNAAQLFSSGDLVTLDSNRLDSAIALGEIIGTAQQSGALTDTIREVIYQFQVGAESDDDAVFPNLPRNLSVLLSGFTGEIEVELITDPLGDGIGEVYSSAASNTNNTLTLDETQLPSGIYYLRVTAPSANTNFNVSLTVPPLPVPNDSAGNDSTKAFNLGDVTNQTKTITDFVGEVDGEDFYQITLSVASNLQINVDGLDQGDVALAIGRKLVATDVDLDYLSSSNEDAAESEAIDITLLPAGEYFIRVTRVSGNTSYSMKVTASTASMPADKAGNSVASAFNLGEVVTTASTTDFIGSIDPTDLYRFSLANVAGLTVDLEQLSADADLEMYYDENNNGQLEASERLARSSSSGSVDEQMSFAGLAIGTYFVRVAQFEGDTDYTLTLSTRAATGADLSVSRVGDATSSELGSQFTYKVRVTNNGPDTASNVRLTETLPEGLDLVRVTKSVPIGSIQITSTGFVGTLPSLGAGGSVDFEITVTSFIAGLLATTSRLTSDTDDYDMKDNSIVDLKSVQSIVSPPADIELTLAATNLKPNVGDSVEFTVSVTNLGPGTATDIQVTSLLPAGLSVDSVDAAPGSNYVSATGRWTVGNIPPNDTVELVISATVTSNAPVRVVAEVTAVAESDPDSTPANNAQSEDDYAAVTLNARPTGLTFVSEPLSVGLNRIEVINARPGTVINLVRGAALGATRLDRFSVTVDIAAATVVAQAIVQNDGRAFMIVSIRNASELSAIALQAFEHAANPQKTEVLTANSSLPVTPATQDQPTTRSTVSSKKSVSVFDANSDGVVSPIDALIVINHLNRPDVDGESFTGDTAGARARKASNFGMDVNDDGYVTPLDALLIINRLNSATIASGEGEARSVADSYFEFDHKKWHVAVDEELVDTLSAPSA